MENWNKRFLLAVAFCTTLPGYSYADEQPQQLQVIDPEVDRREITTAKIDTENFEVGPFVGVISIQDFSSEVVYGVRGAWHITEDFFFEASYGSSEGDLTSYEKLSGGVPLFKDSDRDYTYYDLNLGWNALPGEVFVFGDRALKSDLYFIGGVGSTEFLGDSWFTVSLGAGYRLLLNDWIAWRIDVRDHIFDRDTFGKDETTNNIELTTSITFFF